MNCSFLRNGAAITAGLMVSLSMSGMAWADNRLAAPAPTTGQHSAAAAPASGSATPVSIVPVVNSISQDVKIATTIGAEQQQAIAGFIAYQVSQLEMPISMPADQKSLSAARGKLSNECEGTGSPASPAFRDEYDKQLNAALKPLIEHGSILLRLNCGIVVSNVATHTEASALQLKGAILSLLQPEQPLGICLWGVKAAGKVLTISLPANDKDILNAMMAAVTAKNLDGALTDEAYQSLNPQVSPLAIPELIQIFQQRVESYRTGVPNQPIVDQRPSFFLTAETNWKVLNPQQRDQTIQLLSNLVSMAAQRANDPNVSHESHEQLIELLKRTAAAVKVIADRDPPNPALSAAAASLTRISADTDPKTVTDETNQVTSALKAAFPTIQPPPTVEPLPSMAGPAAAVVGP